MKNRVNQSRIKREIYIQNILDKFSIETDQRCQRYVIRLNF
jgi:hypothetical protein